MLVGDAGYWKDPISAHGITDALRDAELAAYAIVGAAGTSGASAVEWMERYQEVRDRLSNDLFDSPTGSPPATGPTTTSPSSCWR